MTIAVTLALILVARAVPAATVDGANIHWTSRGTGSQTMIFVHGWTCDDTSWDGQVPVFSQNYPTVQYHEIPETGHFLMMEKPDEFNRLLRAFLATIE